MERAGGRRAVIPLPPPDPSLPSLGLALDGDTVRDLLEQHLPDCTHGRVSLESCRATYVRYKPGTGCVVGYALALRDAESGSLIETPAHGRLYAGERAERTWSSRSFNRLLERAVRHHPHPPALRAAYVPEIGALVQLYPLDEDLPGLVRAASSRTMRRVLGEALSGELGGRPERCRPLLVRYKPARKALLRYELGGARVGGVYGKLQTNDRGVAVYEAGRALLGAGVRTAAPVAYLSDLRMLVHEEAPGTRLADLRATPAFGAWMGEAAEALARLHAAEPPSLSPYAHEDEARAVTAAAGAVGAVLPGLAAGAARLAGTVARELTGVSGRPTTIHGDFYDDQVLVSQAGVVILDLEEVRWGDPALDVGNFLAHQSRWEDASAGAGGARATFLDAYAAHRPEVLPSVLLFEAAALLKLAIGPFRRLEPDWPEGVERLLHLCERRLEEHGAQRVPPPVPAPYHDPALPQLRSLLDRQRMAGELERVVYSEPVEVAGAEVARHKPGRRAIVRYDLRVGGEGDARRERLYGKTFASERGPRVYEAIRAITTARACGPEVSLPEPVAYLAALKLLLQREVRGEPIAPLLLEGNVGVAVRIADALYALHSSGLDLRRRHDLIKEVGPLEDRVERLSAAFPQLAALARACLRAVWERSGAVAGWRYRPVHRDFYHDQVLVGAHGLSVLDFDDAAMSEPAVDVANFLAHLRLLSLQRRSGPESIAPVAAAFLDRYGDLDPPLDPALVCLLEGTTLLRLAEIHAPRPSGAWVAERLLEESHRRLGGSASERAMSPTTRTGPGDDGRK